MIELIHDGRVERRATRQPQHINQGAVVYLAADSGYQRHPGYVPGFWKFLISSVYRKPYGASSSVWPL